VGAHKQLKFVARQSYRKIKSAWTYWRSVRSIKMMLFWSPSNLCMNKRRLKLPPPPLIYLFFFFFFFLSTYNKRKNLRLPRSRRWFISDAILRMHNSSSYIVYDTSAAPIPITRLKRNYYGLAYTGSWVYMGDAREVTSSLIRSDH
jgi:hypothetical protein